MEHPDSVVVTLIIAILVGVVVYLVMSRTTGRREEHDAENDEEISSLRAEIKRLKETMEISVSLQQSCAPVIVNQQPSFVRVALDKNAGEPSTYPQMGYLHTASSDLVLPIYGRPSYARRSRYYYYTTVPKSDIKIPVFSTGNTTRDCMEELGCEELFDGDLVEVNEVPGGPWTYKKYRYDRF